MTAGPGLNPWNRTQWFIPHEKVEADAVAQVLRTASMPFVRGVAIMPDVHYGRGSTVGTVVATKGAIMPACVGVDIGCGMIAVRTNLRPNFVRENAQRIREGIERRIPLGIGPYGMNSRILDSAAERIKKLEEKAFVTWNDVNHMNARAKDWRNQIGSLGGGNHFIEICVGHPIEEGFTGPHHDAKAEVWVILHSGSRAVGNKTGTHWTKVAQKQAEKYSYMQWLPDPDLAYLVEKSEEFWEYMKELFWCQEFALLNREEMMDRVLTELEYAMYDCAPTGVEIIEVERINCHHNYVARENHHGENVLVTRKGAILATDGTRGLIPGSMGARSYITTGLGNPGSYTSAPHGAGRRMSRNAARKAFTLEQVTAEMAAKNIEARVRSAIIDEAPGAYKDIDEVMEYAKGLVRPTHVLSQIISIKGD